MKIEIDVPGTETDAIVIQTALQTLAKNLNKSNIQFIADLSRKPDINKKLESKKLLIKASI
jgi:hypothetical protein